MERSGPLGCYLLDELNGTGRDYISGEPRVNPRKENEAEPSGRPRGRIRVCGFAGSKQSQVLHEVRGEGWGNASRFRRPDGGADLTHRSEGLHSGPTALLRLRGMGPLCKTPSILRGAGRRELPGQDGTGACQLHTLAGLLQSAEDYLGDDRGGQLGKPDGMGGPCGAP